MTAVPEPVSWTAPGPGLWSRNFRLGEWLPEAVTPLFATWLLPALEGGYLEGIQETRRGSSAVPIRPCQRLVLQHPSDSHTQTAEPDAQIKAATATPERLAGLVDQLGRQAGIYLWYLAVVGGSAWKMEARLTRFCRQHLARVLSEEKGGTQVLLRGLPGTQPVSTAHAVQSADWYHPVAAELSTADIPPADGGQRHTRLAQQRAAAEQACRAALVNRPRLLRQFEKLLQVNQRYAVIREEQARDLTLGWPVLRACVRRLGEHMVATGAIEQADDVFFRTREEVTTTLWVGKREPIADLVRERRHLWQRQRNLAAPLTLGQPVRLIGDVIGRAVQEARGERAVGENVILGHPASAGRATGPVRIVQGPQDFAVFGDGDVLVAKTTAPAWTPLFARAATVITDSGILAAHASLVAREYGIPAVVATGDATTRLHPGQRVTVDGNAGTITPDTEPITDQR
jgi:phosphohistidine swiveling domain-containing protein